MGLPKKYGEPYKGCIVFRAGEGTTVDALLFVPELGSRIEPFGPALRDREPGIVKEVLPVPNALRPTVGWNGGVSFTALITPIWREVADVSDFGTRRGVYRIVGNLATAVSLTSVESQLKIEKFGGRRVGYWFFATDKSLVQQTPPPDEYLYLVQGALMVGDLFCKFTMLTNDNPSRETELMFKLLLDAAHRTGT